jgi:dimethylamine monooxygenase subunit A
MADPILQDRLFEAPWAETSFRRLPGMRPVEPDAWLLVDEAYAAQMALRDRLLVERREAVLALLPEARDAAAELFDLVRAVLARRGDFAVGAGEVRRPDGRTVPLDAGDPLGTLGRLVQEDLCILQKQDDEHVLTGAVLVFPSGWTLAEKIGRPLMRIHRPVADYDRDIARRVQRLCDGLAPGRPLMRANLLWHRDPALHAPRREGAPKPAGAGDRTYLRSERQCLLRLPRTRAVVFTIHTAVVDAATLTAEERATLERRPE